MPPGAMPKTLPSDAADLDAARRARAVRRVFLALVTLLVLLGLSGLLGVRTGVVSATADGYTLEVTYAAMTRPGLATPFSITVEQDGGFTSGFELETSSAFLEAFDENGLDPEPVASSGDGEWVGWEFDQPDGDTFELGFDARLEPAVQWRRDGITRLLVDDVVVAEVAYTMWVMP